MEKQWSLKPLPSAAEVRALQQSLSLDETLCTLLLQRGMDNLAEARAFFRPKLADLHNPFLMKDMAVAVERLIQAIDQKEKILIYGDYDVDGITSVALAYNFLQPLSDNLFTYIPDRYTEGYGVSEQGIQWAIAHGIKLILTVDCGIAAIDPIGQAKAHHMDTIVCDHHLPSAILPEALAILDPKQEGCTYPYDELSGCGVVFKLLEAFAMRKAMDKNELWNFLDLVAISIACDIVPMTGENRILAWYGLKKLNIMPHPGLEALMLESGMQQPIDVSKIVFGIGPRLNAAGRIAHAKTALDLLMQSSKEGARVFAERLNLQNEERKQRNEKMTQEALDMMSQEGMEQNHATVLFKKDWHKGLIGIVASRCIEHWYKPTIILSESNDRITGSARSVPGFDIHAAISQCSEYLEQFGGHHHAAGLTLQKSQLKNFKDVFERTVSATIREHQKTPTLFIDMEIDLKDLNHQMHGILKQMGPFGPQHMQPVFCSKGLTLAQPPRILKEKHLKLWIKSPDDTQSFEAIGFGLSAYHDQLDAPFALVYTLEVNDFMQQNSLQLVIKDIKPHTA